MSKFIKFSGWALLVMLVVSLLGAGLLMGVAQDGLAQSGQWHIVVDGDTVADAHSLQQAWDSDEWTGAEAFFGIAAGLFCLLLVLPLTLLLGVGLPLLCVMLAFGAVAVSLLGVAALLSAPLLVPLLLVIWLVRRKPTVRA